MAKEKTSEDLVMDFMTKIKNVFKKDIYIKDKLYVFGGKLSDDEVYGDLVCILEPKYKLAMEEFFNDSKLIYIDDVVEFKKEATPHIQYLDDNESEYKELNYTYERIMNHINETKNWRSFSSKSPELLEKIFSDNSSVDFKDEGEEAYITLCKKLFPLVSLKNVENLFYDIHPYQDDMNLMVLDFQFTHFRVYIIYYFLKLS